MILVTGGAGFIGSNLVRALNARGYREIVVADNLTQGAKFANLLGSQITDYIDKDVLPQVLDSDPWPLTAVFHQGACAVTTEWDGRYMMANNYDYSKRLLHWCLARRVPFIYASSAAVYGSGRQFREDPACEAPLNVYGYSKHLFDVYVRARLPAASQVVGLRYFNVYGPRESHKGDMASVAFKLHGQLSEYGKVRLFEGNGTYGNGEQQRDFVYVDDVAATLIWFLDHPQISGIFNVGSGRSQTFNDVAHAVLAHHGYGEIEYIPFPQHLAGRYQDYTEADLTRLRNVGCNVQFRPVERGVPDYLRWLDSSRDALAV